MGTYLTENETLSLVQEYNANDSTVKEMCSTFNICVGTLYSVLNDRGVPRRYTKGNFAYRENSDFFESIDSEISAYWLGFLAADGNIQDGQHNAVVLSLQSSDKDHLRLFLNHLNSNRPVYCSQDLSVSQVAIHNRQMVSDLAKHGIVPRKTHILEFPTTVPQEFLSSWIRGYFDGDGSVRIGNKNQLRVQWSGTLSVLIGIREELERQCRVKRTKIHKCLNAQTTHVFGYGGNRSALKVLEYLYKDAKVYLQRKADCYFNVLGQVCESCGKPVVLNPLCKSCQMSFIQLPRTVEEELDICKRYETGDTIRGLARQTRFGRKAIRTMLVRRGMLDNSKTIPCQTN